VKTVPTLRVVSSADALAGLAELGVTDLPGEVQLALADVALSIPRNRGGFRYAASALLASAIKRS
jgi:hypothetical protein